jgi:hypothetical protein
MLKSYTLLSLEPCFGMAVRMLMKLQKELDKAMK